MKLQKKQVLSAVAIVLTLTAVLLLSDVEAQLKFAAQISPTYTTVAAGQSATFTATVSSDTPGTPPYKYQWYDDHGAIAGQTTSQLMISETLPGTYTFNCIVTDATGLTTSSPYARLVVTAAVPTPTPTPAPTPTPSPTVAPTATPTVSPSATPSPTQSPSGLSLPIEVGIVIAVVVIIIIIAVAVLLLRKRAK